MQEQQVSDIQTKLKQERKPRRMKRFYKKATLKGKKAPFGIALDGKIVKTPLKNLLEVPGRALGRAMVVEWNQQGEFIDIPSMFINKYVNTAIDRVGPRIEAIADEIAAFASSDLVCYRAETPQGLVELQASQWDEVLNWAEEKHQLKFVCVAGIIYATQPDASLGKLHQLMLGKDAFALTAVHNMTTLLGSALLAIRLAEGDAKPDETWDAAHIDEDWNARLWGEDDDAIIRRKQRRTEFDGIVRFLELAKKK